MLGDELQDLGETFDIHGGGADLQFRTMRMKSPGERAANGLPLARFWMHNGFQCA
jgi:cysteinyl-tRNA synthetase